MSSLQVEVEQSARSTEELHNNNNVILSNATNQTPRKKTKSTSHKNKLSKALEKLTCNFKKQTQTEMHNTLPTYEESDTNEKQQNEYIRAVLQEKAEKEYKAELKHMNDVLLETKEQTKTITAEFKNSSLSNEAITNNKITSLTQYFIPPLYLRKRNPAADEARSVLRNAVKAIELHLRFKEIERYDEMHAKFYELLTANNRTSVTKAEFVEIINEINKWNEERAAKTEKEMEQTSNVVAASIASSYSNSNNNNTINNNNNSTDAHDMNASNTTGQHERAPSQPRSLLNSPSSSSQPHHQRQHSRSSCNNNNSINNTNNHSKSHNNNNNSSLVHKTPNNSMLSEEPTSVALSVKRTISEHMSQLPGICLLLSSSSSSSSSSSTTAATTTISSLKQEKPVPLSTHEPEMQETEPTSTTSEKNETDVQKNVKVEKEKKNENSNEKEQNEQDKLQEEDETLEQLKLKNDEKENKEEEEEMKSNELETWGSSLRDVLYESTITPPCINLEMFMNAPRSLFNNTTVNVSTLYQIFAKGVSLMKCEAELVMWDTNNDGRLSEDEVENYVRDLVPRIAALQNLSEELLPFYCCTVSRRIFWDLDQSNRGMIRIEALLQSTIMEEWVQLQLMTEDSPTNWFGSIVTQHLYEKFLLLDTRNEGTLNVQNLRRYKKGLPTVIDDGLPINVSPLSSLFIDRFFETNVMMANCELDYRKFVDFVIAVEKLPQCSRPLFFWHILDLHHTNVLTPLTVNYFFRETHAKLVSAGLVVPPREVVMQEVFDLIPSSQPLCITRDEFVQSPQAGLFVSLIIDCLSFWTYENREQR